MFGLFQIKQILLLFIVRCDYSATKYAHCFVPFCPALIVNLFQKEKCLIQEQKTRLRTNFAVRFIITGKMKIL